MRNVGGTPGEGIGSAVERLRFFFLRSKMWAKVVDSTSATRRFVACPLWVRVRPAITWLASLRLIRCSPVSGRGSSGSQSQRRTFSSGPAETGTVMRVAARWTARQSARRAIIVSISKPVTLSAG